MESTQNADNARKGLIAAGGVIGALLASSCCIAPLLLLTLGVGGAWMGGLTALAPYQYYFITATLLFIGAGHWYVYWKPKQACDEGAYCASPASDRIVKIALWFATALVVLSLGVNFILPYFI